MATFSVNDQVRRVTAQGNGNLVDFNFSFQVNNTSDLKVFLGSTQKQETNDYSVVTSTGSAGLNADGTGTIRFVSAPTSSDTVVILSDVPVARSSVYSSGGNVTAQALEGDFDTITMQIGDLEEKNNRSIKAPVDEPATSSFTIPSKSARLGKLLSFNSSTGNPEVSDPAVSSASIGAVTTLGAGVSATASATYTSSTGDISFSFGIPQGSQGSAGANGVFSAIASQSEAQAGTENTKGMTPLRVSQAISTQVSASSGSRFFGIYKDSATGTLKVDQTTSGGSEALVLSEYDDNYIFASGSVTFAIDTNGHLQVTLP
ncbi:MAG: hypothetical protein CMI34_05210 [Opitutales bacterium]|nr:hypothetical protein [Opitutales bacterium]|tara:strand:+ start:729 stop:1679 length:951 start_codon:yes stop_codon:yes gene_type:complete